MDDFEVRPLVAANYDNIILSANVQHEVPAAREKVRLHTVAAWAQRSGRRQLRR